MFTSEDSELGTADEREHHVTFVFLDLGYLTQNDIFSFIHVSEFHFSLQLSSILPYVGTTFSLSIQQLKDILVVSIF